MKLQTNLAGRDALIAALKIHIGDAREYDDIWDILPVETPKVRAKQPSAKPVDGSVYLIESDEFFKVGHSDELERCAKKSGWLSRTPRRSYARLPPTTLPASEVPSFKAHGWIIRGLYWGHPMGALHKNPFIFNPS